MNKIIFSFIIIFNLLVSNHQNLFSQNCSGTSVGFSPINDLGNNYFRNFQGGLYPGGSNVRPDSHNSNGLNIAKNIKPLDTAGNYDPNNGRIVLLSVGMSNTSLEFTEFMNLVSSATNINPKLTIVNGAQGGKDINKIINPSDSFWIVINQRLLLKGVTMKQVQVVWYKEAEAGPADTSFPGHPLSIKVKFKTVMNILKSRFINLNLCYNTSRIYAGYATSSLSPEPSAYYNGWAVKWMIEDQINGDTSLKYSDTNPNSPWLSWGPYVWADGIIPRSDGLTWNCPVDYNPDGTHPSATGRMKVATRLLNFFSTDETTKPWFLKTLTLNLTLAMEGFYNPVPGNLTSIDTVRIYLRNFNSPYNIVDSAKDVINDLTLQGVYKFYNLTSGSYYYEAKHRNCIETWSKAGGEYLNFGVIYSYDFTNFAFKAYGNNLVLKGTRYCLFSGDLDNDGVIDANDILDCYNDVSGFANGYFPTDVTGDNVTDVSDIVIIYNNANNFVVKITP